MACINEVTTPFQFNEANFSKRSSFIVDCEAIILDIMAFFSSGFSSQYFIRLVTASEYETSFSPPKTTCLYLSSIFSNNTF